MAFQIKNFVSIVAAQINHARAVTEKVTDFQPGSVARTLIEAPAVEVEELYLQMFLGLRDAIPVATFRSFGFTKLGASAAVGWVSISSASPRTADTFIPAGTQFLAADGREYVSVQDVTWPAGVEIQRVQVAHTNPGLVGNIAAGQITSSPLFGSGFTIGNSTIETGRDEETDAEREARFAEFIAALSRGTVTACIYAARLAQVLDADGNTSEYVSRVGVLEEPGYVRIFIYSSLGAPSTALLAIAQEIMDGKKDEDTGAITPGYRAAGVNVEVLPVVERAVPLSIRVSMIDGAELTTAVRQSLGDLYGNAIRSVAPGTSLYLGTLVEMLLTAPGVEQIVPSTNANIVCGVGEALIPGTLTIAAL